MLATTGAGARRPISASSSSEFGASTKLASAPAARACRDAGDRFVETDDGERIGAGDDEEIGVAAGIDGGADLVDVLLALDHALAAHVAALLRPLLIFEEAAGGAGVDQLADGADDVERIAVAGVGVDDDRNLDAAADPRGRARRFRFASAGPGRARRSPWRRPSSRR